MLTPIKPAVASTPASPAQPPVALQTITPTPSFKAATASQLNVSFAFLNDVIDAKQREQITHWALQQMGANGHRDADWQHYRLLVHFTHQGHRSQQLAEARAKAVIALLNSAGLRGIPVTTMTDGVPHRVVRITHLAMAPAAVAPFSRSPHPASTSPTPSSASVVPRGESITH